MKVAGTQAGKEGRARGLGQGAARLFCRHGGAWFYAQASGLSREHPGPGTVRTLAILVLPAAIPSLPLLLRGLCFPIIGSLGGPGKPSRVWVHDLREASEILSCEAEGDWDCLLLVVGP